MSGLLGLGGTVADEVLGDGSILENLKKIKAVLQWGWQKMIAKVYGFLLARYYRWFIEEFSMIALPLT